MNAPKERVTKAASLSTDLAKWAEDQAKAENRSFSNFVETLLCRARDAGRQQPQANSQQAPAMAA